MGAENTIFALPFSLRSRQVTGEPLAIAEDAGYPSVSNDQTLVLGSSSLPNRKLVLVNREGDKLGEIGQSLGRGGYFSLSPDGKSVVGGGTRSGWVHQVGGLRSFPLPFRERIWSAPVWSASGWELFFSGRDGGGFLTGAADGSREPRLIHKPVERVHFLSDVSRDGTYMFYDHDSQDIWYAERNAKGSFDDKPFLNQGFTEKAARISPDNRWVAYISHESGKSEVYLRRFPEGDLKRQVSQNGGRGVRWSRDGKRLYYMHEQTVFEVDLHLGPDPKVETPRPALEWPGLWDITNVSSYPRYDVTADGEHFIVPETPPGNPPRIRLWQNWFEVFGQREAGDE